MGNNFVKKEKEILSTIPPSHDEQWKQWLDSIKESKTSEASVNHGDRHLIFLD